MGRMRGRGRRAAVEQQRQERVEGGHGAAGQGAESGSQQVQTHERRKRLRLIQQQGKDGGSRLCSTGAIYALKGREAVLLQLTDACVLRSTFCVFSAARQVLLVGRWD